MSTNWISKSNITRKWLIINAEGLDLGRLSSYIAFLSIILIDVQRH